jgi:hypothetical protein
VIRRELREIAEKIDAEQAAVDVKLLAARQLALAVARGEEGARKSMSGHEALAAKHLHAVRRLEEARSQLGVPTARRFGGGGRGREGARAAEFRELAEEVRGTELGKGARRCDQGDSRHAR